MYSYSYAQEPTTPLAIIPCEISTTPESTISEWDWQVSRFQFHYKYGNAPSGILEVDSPFHNDEGFSFHPNTAHFLFHPGEANDYQVEDGWELLYRNFGTEIEPVGEPSFGLYNRYDARVRIFFYIEPNGESPYQNGRILARHFTSENSFENVTALFEHLNIPSNALIDFDKSNLEVSQLNEVIINGTWMYLEFVAAYDPCVCLHPSAIEVKPVLSNISTLSFSLAGTATSTAVYSSSSATSDPLGFHRSALKYSNGLFSSITSGFSVFKGLNAIPDSTQGLFGTIANLPPWFSGIGAASKILAFLVGGGKTVTSSKLMGFNHDFKFDGTGEVTTDADYDPVLLYTPGSYQGSELPNANKPIYNNPLGIFAVLEPPVIKMSYSSSSYSTGDGFISQTYATYQFDGDLKYKVNQLAGINETPFRLMGALVFHDCSDDVSGDSWTSFGFRATPLINIECLADYIAFGVENVYGSKDGSIQIFSEGCTTPPEFQIVAVLENAIYPDADDILFSARYKPKYVEADYTYSTAPENPFDGMTSEEILVACDPPVTLPILDEKIVQYCKQSYHPKVDKSRLREDDLLDNEEIQEILPVDVVYPNPFLDYFVVKIQEEWANQRVHLQLYDLFGKIVWQEKFLIKNSGLLEVGGSFSSLPLGQYYLQVQGENFISSIKLIKQ